MHNNNNIIAVIFRRRKNTSNVFTYFTDIPGIICIKLLDVYFTEMYLNMEKNKETNIFDNFILVYSHLLI